MIAGQINFKQFSPSDDLVIYSHLILEQLVELAPEESVVFATVIRDFEAYRCHVEIFSRHEEFQTDVVSEDPRLVIDNMDKQMRSAISKWRTDCFRDLGAICWPKTNTEDQHFQNSIPLRAF